MKTMRGCFDKIYARSQGSNDFLLVYLEWKIMREAVEVHWPMIVDK